MPVPLPIYHYRSRDPEVFHQSHGWFQPSFLRESFFGLQGRVGLLFVAGSIFTGVLSAGGGGTTSFGESGQVVVLAAGRG